LGAQQTHIFKTKTDCAIQRHPRFRHRSNVQANARDALAAVANDPARQIQDGGAKQNMRQVVMDLVAIRFVLLIIKRCPRARPLILPRSTR